MNRRMVIYVTGRVTFVVGLLMILPIIVAFIYHEGHETIYPLFQAMVCTLAVGAAMAARPPKRRSIYVREGLAITGLSWILLVIFGSLPYLFTGAIPSVVDAIFESASGFTTTGSSILTDIESLPHSILFWRNFTNFLGGTEAQMSTILFSLFVVFQLFNALNSRELSSTSIFRNLLRNRMLLGVFALTFLLQVFITQVGGAFFGTVPLPLAMWGKIIATGFTVILLSEIVKFFQRLAARR